MRIVFIGDLQYATAEEEDLGYKMEQIRALSPDLAVVMGDIGGSHMGSVGGLEETKRYVDMIGCEYRVILGNHDVEYSPYDDGIFDYLGAYRSVFTGKEPFSVIKRGGILVICVSVGHRPAEDFRTHNAVYVGDEDFEKVVSALEENPGIPTVLVTHAPLAGSGLRRWMPLHCAATDYYLDQTFDALRWRRLLQKYPQIRFSVSAHLHMSHEYRTALTFADGVMHISCGVMTICARDDIFQTRFMDITPEKAEIFTLSHTSGEVRRDAVYKLDGKSFPEGNAAFPRKHEMLLGEDEPAKVFRFSGKEERYYAATKKGYLWEYVPSLAEFTGAIALGAGAEEMSFDGSRLYVKTFSGEVFSFDPDSSGRYERIGGYTPQEKTAEPILRGETLPETSFSQRRAKEGMYVIIAV